MATLTVTVTPGPGLRHQDLRLLTRKDRSTQPPGQHGLAVEVNDRKNRARSCLNQTTSTLSVRGYAIGRWPRFKPWQGGSANAADRVIAVVQPVEPVRLKSQEGAVV